MRLTTLLISIFFFWFSLSAQTIDQKQKGESFSSSLSEAAVGMKQQIRNQKKTLQHFYKKVETLYEEQAPKEAFADVLQKIQRAKQHLNKLQQDWKYLHKEEAEEGEGYAFLQEEDSSLFQFILDYASRDTLYIVPDEIKELPIHIASQFPIPQESWDEIIELLMEENGIGIEEINPFVKRLFPLHEGLEGVHAIVTSEEELHSFPEEARIGFFFSVSERQKKKLSQLLETFTSTFRSAYYEVDEGILCFSKVKEISKLLKITSFLTKGSAEGDFYLLPTQNISPATLADLLSEYFSASDSSFSCQPIENSSSLLFITGSPSELQKAQAIHQALESEMSISQEKTIYCYRAKNSDVKDLVNILEKAYPAVLSKSNYAIGSAPSVYAKQSQETPSCFLAEEKTDTIIMIVESQSLTPLLNLLKKIDIPKQMVQLEVLFFEKKSKEQNNRGLNLLRMGSRAAQDGNLGGIGWNVQSNSSGAEKSALGIFEFFLSREKRHHIPAYDLSYRFLISQEDLQVNASPTVTTINQTPALIRLVDEISINTGVVAINTDANDNSFLKDSYNREEFGITLEITPIINAGNYTEEPHITLKTNVRFDTNNSRSSNPRPDITKREIKNEVRIANGESVILGGLKRKMSNQAKDSVPFLGSIPGFGKIFSSQEESHDTTDMFICITPKIIQTAQEAIFDNEMKALKSRPGDLPEIEQSLQESQKWQAFQSTQKAYLTLLGESLSQHKEDGEYDGN